MTTGSPLDRESTSREFFEELYRTDPDPWRFSDDAYEQARYQHLLAHIPAGRYDTAFEPGCSIGVLTRQLADRCRRVIAIDIAEAAVAEARRRCVDQPGVELSRGELPGDLPGEPVDLVVLSEIGYYFTEPVLIDLARGSVTRSPQAGASSRSTGPASRPTTCSTVARSTASSTTSSG